MSKLVADYQLIDHGIDGSQYFTGCGTAFTKYTHCVTGIGENPAEAIEDCLEQIACGDGDVDTEELEARILSDEGWTEFPTSPSVAEQYPAEEPCGDCDQGIDTDYSNELHYHVSIRYNVGD